ncbi:MAG: helicase, partial [Lachnospiraceae bacterium]|nr:helicase [Lachnospiraceae bacterium]
TDRYLAKALEKYAHIPTAGGQIPYTILAAAGSYLDWLLMSMGCGDIRIRLEQVPVQELVGEELVRQLRTIQSREALVRLGREKGPGPDGEFGQKLEQYLDYRYPYEADISLHTKMSVSELKQQGQMTDETESARLEEILEPDWQRWLAPGMGREEAEAVPAGGTRYGATRGTAYHRALELLAFDQVHTLKDVEDYLMSMVDQSRFTKEAYGMIDCRVIWRFLESDLGKRMSLAQKEGRLSKEQQFVMGIPAREMDAADSDELVVIQGILDACFEEEGQLVLVDYKTDYVTDRQELVDRYRRQLDYYERALGQMTGKTVKEKIIYSMKLQEEIRL